MIENVLVFNNACWAIGELGHKVPKTVKDADCLLTVVNLIGEILELDMIGKRMMQQNQALMNHFQKTVAIALGRLCILDA